MGNITYTSTIEKEIWQQVSEVATKYGKTKKEIIESSLKEHLYRIKQREFEEGFKKLANDTEMEEMAEWGIGEYFDQLSKL